MSPINWVCLACQLLARDHLNIYRRDQNIHILLLSIPIVCICLVTKEKQLFRKKANADEDGEENRDWWEEGGYLIMRARPRVAPTI